MTSNDNVGSICNDRSSLVYKGYPPNHCCCDSALRILPNGEWLTFFMTGGLKEPELANHVVLCRSTDRGESWGFAEVVKRYDDHACLLSEVYLSGDELILFLERHNGWFDEWRNYTMRSSDGGRSWTEPEVFAPYPRRTFIRNLFVTSRGEWIFPVQSYDTMEDWTVSPLDDGSFKHPFNSVLISADRGASWEKGGRVEPSHAWAENNVVELSDGRLIMLIRWDGKGCLFRSESIDRGRTWSETVPTDIPNPGTKFRLHRLSDGRIILIHNPNPRTSHPNSPKVPHANCARNPLSMWISDDDMNSWSYKRDLVTFPGMLSYPDGVVDDKEEWVHFAFDYNRHDVIYHGAAIPKP